MTEINFIPRKIWILWYQGISQAPFMVKKCIDSWIKENPNWEITILDTENLSEYITLDVPDNVFSHLVLSTQSELVRLQLLSQYGGIWADATTFCMKPLNSWINDCTTSGFFAFHKPGPDRVLSTWFLASTPENPLILKLNERFTGFWIENDFMIPNQFQRIAITLFEQILERNEILARYWLSPIPRKLLKIYPYFALHYMFEILVSNDLKCKTIWQNTRKVSADGPHKLQEVGLLSPISETIKTEIDNKLTPIYKLNWRDDCTPYPPDSVLSYLMQERG